MKSLINTVLIVLFIVTFQGCGTKHQSGDGHVHGDEKPAGSAEEDHEEGPANIAVLTKEQMDAVGIEVGQIEHKELTATIRANGNLLVPNNNKANATSLFGGIVKRILVQVGDNVRQGQVIATIENPQFIQLQEEYLTIESRIVLARQEQTRQNELTEGNAGARKNLQLATAELNTLLTRQAALRKQIQIMGIEPDKLSNSTLRSALVVASPIAGTVSNLFSKIGSYVDVSSPVAEIVDNRLLHLDLQVFEKDLPKMKVGQVIHFTLTNNPTAEYDARIFSIGASFENESKTIAVHCNVVGNKAGLIDGMNITGVVSLNNVTSPVVPNTAIVEADSRYYIFVLRDGAELSAHQHKDGEEEHGHPPAVQFQGAKASFEKIEVVKGVSDMGYTGITPVADLPNGTRIVTKGAFFINAKLSNTEGHDH